MTIHEITNQLYDMSVAGYFNGEKFTKEQLGSYIRNFTRECTMKVGESHYMEIALPDGWWLMKISKFGKGEFEYYIPDTREQELKLKQKLENSTQRV